MKTIVITLVFMNALLFGCSSSSPDQMSRQQRIEANPQWNGKKFQNIDPTPDPSIGEMGTMFWDLIFKKPKGGTTDTPLPAERLDLARWPKDRDLQFAWLGHTTYLFEVEGKWVLTDPMFSKSAGPIDLFSPKRYSDLPISAEQLPHIDVVLITHNHYDHLDKASIQALIPKTDHFIAPLAVGSLMLEWGVPPEKITELEWWQTKQIDNLTITSAPAQHFSSRSLFDRNETLWTSYGIRGKNNNIFLSGDTGWHKELYEIGERLGPFDLTIFEMGAYGKYRGWKEIHLTPEEAVKAHQAVKGKVTVPSHWGTFDLAFFRWEEPIERFVVAADLAGISYLTPKIGERINPGHDGGNQRWWRPFIKKNK